MRADIHGGQEHKRSVQGPDTEAQDLSPPNRHFRLATRGRSIQTCQKLTRAVRQNPRLFDHLVGNPNGNESLVQMRWKISSPRTLTGRPFGPVYVAIHLVARGVGLTKRPNPTMVTGQFDCAM